MPCNGILSIDSYCEGFVFCLNTGDVGEDIVITVSDFEAGQYTFRVSAVDVFEQSVNREFPFTLTGK